MGLSIEHMSLFQLSPQIKSSRRREQQRTQRQQNLGNSERARQEVISSCCSKLEKTTSVSSGGSPRINPIYIAECTKAQGLMHRSVYEDQYLNSKSSTEDKKKNHEKANENI